MTPIAGASGPWSEGGKFGQVVFLKEVAIASIEPAVGVR